MLALTHLGAILGKNDSRYDAVLESRLTEEASGKNCQGIEPTSCLVETFVYEVGREDLIPVFTILKWIVLLSIWHGARLEPTVEDIRDPSHSSLSIRTWPSDVVDEVLMKILYFVPALLLQFLDASDHLQIIGAIALPDWDRVTPESISAYCPVTSSFKPLAETTILDMVRNPSDLVVAFKHSLLDLLDIDKPTGHCFIDERHSCSVAEWIRVEIVFPLYKLSIIFQPLDDGFICVLDKDSLPLRYFRSESALFVYRTDYRASRNL